jgi:four helix bundle protein
MGDKINTYKDLRVYQNAIDSAMKIFELAKKFPLEEKYSLVDQIRRSSRSVCANLAEAWRKRRYKAAFIAKLSDAESEACETQVWIEFASRCCYLDGNTSEEMDKVYDQIIGQIVKMIDDADHWTIIKKQSHDSLVALVTLSPYRRFSCRFAPVTSSPRPPFVVSLVAPSPRRSYIPVAVSSIPINETRTSGPC